MLENYVFNLPKYFKNMHKYAKYAFPKMRLILKYKYAFQNMTGEKANTLILGFNQLVKIHNIHSFLWPVQKWPNVIKQVLMIYLSKSNSFYNLAGAKRTWSLIHKAHLRILHKFWKFSLLKYTQFYYLKLQFVFFNAKPILQ